MKSSIVLLFLFTVFLQSCAIQESYQKLKLTERNYRKSYEDKTRKAVKIFFTRDSESINVYFQTIDRVDLSNFESRLIHSTSNSDETKDDAILEAFMAENRILLVGYKKTQIYDIKSWKLIETYQNDGYRKIKLSPSGRLIEISGKILDIDTGKVLVNSGADATVKGVSSFSPGDKNYVVVDALAPVSIVSLEENDLSQKRSTLAGGIINSVLKVEYVDENTFYIDDKAKSCFDSLSCSTNLYKVVASSNKIVASYSPKSPISCWTSFANDSSIAVFLKNGHLEILDKDLNKKSNFQISSRVKRCVGSKHKNEIWFDSRSSGIFHVNLDKHTISNSAKFDYSVSDISISPDEKHLGVVGRNQIAIYIIE